MLGQVCRYIDVERRVMVKVFIYYSCSVSTYRVTASYCHHLLRVGVYLAESRSRLHKDVLEPVSDDALVVAFSVEAGRLPLKRFEV